MSAQDARIADAVNAGVGVALGALEEVIGVPVVPAFRREIEKATAKGIKATLDALGFETGHVIITGELGAVVGFRVLPPDPGGPVGSAVTVASGTRLGHKRDTTGEIAATRVVTTPAPILATPRPA